MKVVSPESYLETVREIAERQRREYAIFRGKDPDSREVREASGVHRSPEGWYFR